MRHAVPLVLVVALAGCPLQPPPAVAHVRHGPAFGAPLVTVVALPATPADCTPAECGAAATAVRIALELAGYTVVDAELLNAEMRRRTVKTTTVESAHAVRPPPQNPFAPPSSDTTTATHIEGGRVFQEASPQEQGALVRDVGADAMLETQIVSAPGEHSWITHYTVALTLRAVDGTVVWHSECVTDQGDFASDRQAIELATRCALESAFLW